MNCKRSYRDLYSFCSRLMVFMYWSFTEGSCPEDQYDEICAEFETFAKPREDKDRGDAE